MDKALRKKGLVEASELGVLLAFLQDQSDDQMSQWMIRDTDEPEIIAAFVRARAAKGAWLGVASTNLRASCVRRAILFHSFSLQGRA